MKLNLKPVFKYFEHLDAAGSEKAEMEGGRIIKRNGRCGINTTSIHSKFRLERHNLNDEKGAVTLWFMPLEDLATMKQSSAFAMSNPWYMNYTLLADCENPGNYEEAVFSITWSNTWYPQLFAKFYKGKVYPDAYNPKEMAFVAAGHFDLRKDKWYQLCFTWDKSRDLYQLYINGILVGVSNSLTKKLEYEVTGDILYGGNPCMCISDICFYQEFIGEESAEELFLAETGEVDEEMQMSIKKVFKADDLEHFDWHPTDEWESKLVLSLTEPEDLNRFYVQGCPTAPSITKDGLLVETAMTVPRHGRGSEPDMDQVYLWSDCTFEGDLYVEYEFNALKEGGLGLLMFQASGMQREDFMKDYPLRTDGSMKTVTSEDIRNYHWEFYREMNDVRNEVSSHVLVKNPWFKPMGYVCKTELLRRNEWHKLQLLQEDRHIRCVIDGEIVLDLWDDPYCNNGPVLNFGRIAIRCMVRTRMLFRNLRVYNKIAE